MRLRATRISTGIRPIQKGLALFISSIFATATAGNAQTFRYEADDMSFMFQDSTGTAQVIAFEQPVGLLLDKSKDTTSTINIIRPLEDAQWPTTSGTSSIVFNGSYIECTVATAGGRAAPSLTARKLYRAEMEIYDYVSGSFILPYDGTGSNAKQCSRSGKFSHTFFASVNTLFLYSINFIGKVRNIRVYEVPYTELVANGHFDSTSDWTLAGTASIGSGQLTLASAVAGSPQATNTNALVAGKTYELVFTIASISSGGISIGTASSAGTLRSTVGTFREIFTAATSGAITVFARSVATNAIVDAIYIRELPGNHLSQATTTARPVLSARANEVTESEFRNGIADAPTRNGATAVAMSGYAGAIALAYDGVTTNYAYKTQNASVIGNFYTLSVVVEMDDGLPPAFGSSTAISPLNDFALTMASNNATNPMSYSVTALGSNRYRVATTFAATATGGNFGVAKYGAMSNRTFKFTAIHIESRGYANPGAMRYQRITTASEYDAAGFPSYLRFDGIDDCLFTSSNVDFSNTNKMTLVTAFQKNSDVTSACIAELSDNLNTNNGTFYIFAPSANASPNLTFSNKGTTGIALTNAAQAAPVARVLTGIADIPAPYIGLRIDGALTHFNAGTQGTGNYGSYPLYMGRRANNAQQFNGQIYSLYGLGKSVSPDEVLRLEQYAAQLQGRTLS